MSDRDTLGDRDTLDFIKVFLTLSPRGRLLVSCLVKARLRGDSFEVVTIKRAILGCWSAGVDELLLDRILKSKGGA